MAYVLSLLVLVMLSSSAGAQSAGRPSYSVGDEWTLSSGAVRRVVKVDGDTIVRSTTGMNATCQCLYYFDKNLNIVSIEQVDGKPMDVMVMRSLRVGSDWKYWDFPLQVGKKWSFSAPAFSRGSPIVYDHAISVEAFEDVVTKAGTFKAFRTQREVSIRPNNGSGKTERWIETLWFSPDVKATVKFTSTVPGKDWELAAYDLK